MVYTMVIKVDGGCRGNGQQGAIGAAAAVILGRNGVILKIWTCELPNYPRATNQRAEISAIILALELALEKYNSLSNNVYMDVTIMSDSRYAVECMNTWIYKWVRNGWINAKGNEVANQDLIKKASNMDDNLKERGRVTYKWISRSENGAADEACNNQMDNMGRADESENSLNLDSMSTRARPLVASLVCMCGRTFTDQEALEQHKRDARRISWQGKRRTTVELFNTPRPQYHKDEYLQDMSVALARQHSVGD